MLNRPAALNSLTPATLRELRDIAAMPRDRVLMLYNLFAIRYNKISSKQRHSRYCGYNAGQITLGKQSMAITSWKSSVKVDGGQSVKPMILKKIALLLSKPFWMRRCAIRTLAGYSRSCNRFSAGSGVSSQINLKQTFSESCANEFYRADHTQL